MTEDQMAAYKTAKSTRPSWANALIVAAVLFIAAGVMAVLMGWQQAGLLALATVIALAVAGILALVSATRRVP